ncbi:hypothetical protein PY650_22460 [Rhizobium calliandrae]|uniref:Uncharacterized protein n=1 Tax=Rhizobium calliandrae TaxID=1312182 RepID=A0ABT7KIA4_9HYPH|nr:hypothetical protein [Rhizobium calliandrae]MDL2408361.1 hypothetical protein [Rhizobium calliandrae]
MRLFAILTMLIAWLFYGAMPALAHCPICTSEIAMPVASTMSMHEAMPGIAIDHGSMVVHADSAAPDKRSDNPCADGMAHVPSCAACLAVAPLLTMGDGKALAFCYPAPTHAQPLADSRPAPTAPPPRFA